MTVKELSQLYHLNREIEMDKWRLGELDREIKADTERLSQLEQRVTGLTSPAYVGMPKGTSGANPIETGVAELVDLRDAIDRKRALRSDCAMTIQAKQILCLAERNRLERYISGIPDSLIRMIFTYRFVDGLTWAQVSGLVGVRATEDSVKKLCYLFLDGENSGVE
mgnify:CR=1 FL=1